MSTTTARDSKRRIRAAPTPSVDEPEFSVEFTLGRSATATNSFHWAGAGQLRIGPYGVFVTARRGGLRWFWRRQRHFVPSSEIHNVYRERDAIRVELHSGNSRQQFFQFWTGDLKSAATIVALLPTASTVEFEEGPAADHLPQDSHSRRNKTDRRLAGVITAAIGLFALTALLAALWFVQWEPVRAFRNAAAPATAPTALTTATSTTHGVVAPRVSHSDVIAAQMRFERFDARIEALATEFSLAFAALQVGELEAADFSAGLEKWQIPQWQTLRDQFTKDMPRADSGGREIHAALAASARHWQSALTLYSSGLRVHRYDTVMSAFAEMKRAEESERLARGLLAELQSSQVIPVR
jgi:succinate dehydrogenase hydrophobic anchor subunit